MVGNVLEWCLDGWDLSANYPASAVADPLVSAGSHRVTRGGCWSINSSFSRSALRYGLTPSVSSHDLGFRVVLAPIVP
jgi:formylglycine-generating enzyme required for sulfatase activity